MFAINFAASFTVYIRIDMQFDGIESGNNNTTL